MSSDRCDCGHPRIFHYQPEGCLYEITRRYFDPRQAQVCSCTEVRLSPTGDDSSES